MDNLINVFFNPDIIEKVWPFLLQGLWMTLLLSLTVVPLGLAGGLVVALPELLNNARQAQALTYNPTPIVLAALMYLVLLWPLVRLLSRLEHKSTAVR